MSDLFVAKLHAFVRESTRMLKVTMYPTMAWTLTPSFKPVEVALVKHLDAVRYPGWHESLKGKPYKEENLFSTKDEAIAEGRSRVERIEWDISKRKSHLDKKKLILDKAEGKGDVARRRSRST